MDESGDSPAVQECDSPARVVIVTGANSGVGFGAAKLLAERNYDVILACRSGERAREAMDKIRLENRAALLTYHHCDLSELSSVQAFVDWFLSTGKPLYGLLNNGGVLMSDGPKEMTKDGFEITFEVNHLSHFLMTLLLLDKLKESAKLYGETRIAHVGSGWHSWKSNSAEFTDFVKQPVDFEDLNLEKEGAYNWIQAYKNSKAAQTMFSMSLARSLEGTNVLSNICTPGMVASTAIFRHRSWRARLMLFLADNWVTRSLTSLTSKPMDRGVQHLVDLIDDEDLKGVSGIYYREFTRYTSTSEVVSDECADRETQNRMWRKSCDMINRPEFNDLLVP